MMIQPRPPHATSAAIAIATATSTLAIDARVYAAELGRDADSDGRRWHGHPGRAAVRLRAGARKLLQARPAVADSHRGGSHSHRHGAAQAAGAARRDDGRRTLALGDHGPRASRTWRVR